MLPLDNKDLRWVVTIISSMNKNRTIQFRVTKVQHERIKNNADAKGFNTVSAYLRDLALNRDMDFQDKFNEMYSVIVKGDKSGK